MAYLFGDNTLRRGFGGQAKEMRGEPNAIGIATKATPTSGTNAFFSDAEFDKWADVIDADFMPAYIHLLKGGIVVVPEDGLGTGLSELPQRAPNLAMFVDAWIMALRAVDPEMEGIYFSLVLTEGEESVNSALMGRQSANRAEIKEELEIVA